MCAHLSKLLPGDPSWLRAWQRYHYPVCRLDIRQNKWVCNRIRISNNC